MIAVRRAAERAHECRARRDTWHTFKPGGATPAFGVLERLDEFRLPPAGAMERHPKHDAEILTYIWEGSIAQEDSLGNSGVLHAGEFQRLTAAGAVRHSERNASSTEWAHGYQIWLRPESVELDCSGEEKRFSVAQRKGGLCVVASADGRKGSLRIHQDALIHSAVLDAGQHVVHELGRGRAAWLQVLEGQISLEDTVLNAGDSAGVSAERAVSITALRPSEIFLIDVPERPARVSEDVMEGGPALAS